MELPNPNEVAGPLYSKLLGESFLVTFLGASDTIQPENANWKFEVDSCSQELSNAFDEILESLDDEEDFTLEGRTGSVWKGITSSYIDSELTLWLSPNFIALRDGTVALYRYVVGELWLTIIVFFAELTPGNQYEMTINDFTFWPNENPSWPYVMVATLDASVRAIPQG